MYCLTILPAIEPSPPNLPFSMRCSVSCVSELRRAFNQQDREELKSSAEMTMATAIPIGKLDQSCHDGACFLALWDPGAHFGATSDKTIVCH